MKYTKSQTDSKSQNEISHIEKKSQTYVYLFFILYKYFYIGRAYSTNSVKKKNKIYDYFSHTYIFDVLMPFRDLKYNWYFVYDNSCTLNASFFMVMRKELMFLSPSSMHLKGFSIHIDDREIKFWRKHLFP